MEHVETMCEQAGDEPSVDCIAIDGATVSQLIRPDKSTEVIKAYEGYATKAFIPYITQHL